MEVSEQTWAESRFLEFFSHDCHVQYTTLLVVVPCLLVDHRNLMSVSFSSANSHTSSE